MGGDSPATILVMDDEPGILRFALHVLKNAGYQVAGAGDGQGGLDIVARDAAGIAAVIMDLNMPGMDGRALVGELRRLAPDVPILVLSGYSDEEVAVRLDGTGVSNFIHKPFRPADLVERLGRALAAVSGTGGAR